MTTHNDALKARYGERIAGKPDLNDRAARLWTRARPTHTAEEIITKGIHDEPRNRTIRPPDPAPWRPCDSGARAARWGARLVRRVVPERRGRRQQQRADVGHQPVRTGEGLQAWTP